MIISLIPLCSFSQVSKISIGLSGGQSIVKYYGGENFTGVYFATSAETAVAKNWLSATGRIGLNSMSRPDERIPNFEEISKGVNFDVVINATVRLKRLSASASLGPSLRYAREQHITGTGVPGENGYLFFNTKGTSFGYSAGISLDYFVVDRISLGARVGSNVYLNTHGGQYQEGFGSRSLVLKFKI